MFQVDNHEELDWIMVFDGFEEFEIRQNLTCDLCERSIPSFVLCQTCKNAREKNRPEQPPCAGICRFCEKDVSVLYSCEKCPNKLCMECKFGDDLMPEGVNCCELGKKKEEDNIETKKELESTSSSFGKSPAVKPEHLKLFEEFLELH